MNNYSPANCCVLEAPLDDDEANRLASQLKALADPVRLRLVSMIATAPTGDVCACVFPEALDRSQPTISHHLQQLVKAGVLTREQRGKWAWFRLSVDGLSSIRSALGEGANHAHSQRATVMFLCIHNAGRSQMAAGFLRKTAGNRINVLSAGSTPGEEVNPAAVEVMAEVGIDISNATPQRWTDEMAAQSDVIVSMGCGDECPVYPGVRRLDWELDDPAGQDVDFVRAVRDVIEQRVNALIEELTPSCCG